ncbi:hypothetical protein JCM11641_004182 [Rhodosporidiobolus odoratus]
MVAPSTGETTLGKSTLSSIPRLAGADNLEDWRFSLEMALLTSGAWPVVIGTEPKPTSTRSTLPDLPKARSTPGKEVASGSGGTLTTASATPEEHQRAIKLWEAKDNLAKQYIGLSIDHSLIVHVRGKSTSLEMFSSILSVLETGTRRTSRPLLLGLLWSTKYEEGSEMQTHLNKMADIRLKLQNAGKTIEDEDYASALLWSLSEAKSEDWKRTVALLHDRPIEYLTPTLVTAKLLDEFTAQQNTSTPSKPKTSSALRLQDDRYSGGKKRGGGGGGRGRSGRGSRDKSGDTCNACGEKGHWASDAECKGEKKGGGSGCSGGGNGGRGEGGVRRVNLLALRSEEPATPSRSFYSSISSVAEKASAREKEWLVDSGTDVSICGSKRQLRNFVEEPHLVRVADSHRLTLPGYGSATLRTSLGYEIDLPRVYLLPSAQANLVGTDDLRDIGISTLFGEGGAVLTHLSSDTVVARSVPGSNKILDLVPSDETSIVESNIARVKSQKGVDLHTWHRRFGHASKASMKALGNGEKVKGLTISGAGSEGTCEPCALSHSHRSPFPSSDRRAKQPLDLVHMDVGFADTIAVGGETCYLIVVDDASRAHWVFPMATKGEAYEVWQEWTRLVERQTEKRIKKIRTDNGFEFTSGRWREALKAAGIEHQLSTPYTPEQNGTAERPNRTLNEMALAMLEEAKLPKSRWTFAYRTAVYLKNRFPHAAIDGKTPFEVWNGERADVSNLRVFGSIAYVHIPKEKRTKLDAKALRGTFVGYAVSSKAWEVLLPDGKTLLVSRHVTFAERGVAGEDVPVPSPPDAPKEPVAEETERSEEVGEKLKEVGAEEGELERLPSRKIDGLDPDAILTGPRTRHSRRQADLDLNSPPQEPSASAIYIPIIAQLSDEPNGRDEWEDKAINVAVSLVQGAPRSEVEMRASPHRAEYEREKKNEISAMIEDAVFSQKKKPPGVKAVKAKFAYAEKVGASGSVERRKARFIAKGFSQRYGVDYYETFTPVAKIGTARILFAIAAKKGLVILQFDFTRAYLNAPLDEEIWVEIPEGWPFPYEEGDYLLLNRALYGLKQSGAAWNTELDETLKKKGWIRSATDVCLYTKKVNGELVYLLIYVDDGLVACSNYSIARALIDDLATTYKLKFLGHASHYLSLQIHRDPSTGSISLSQKRYVRDILQRFGFDNPKYSPPRTPFPSKPTGTRKSRPFDRQRYQSAIGALMYAAITTRPDIAASVSSAAQFASAPLKEDWLTVKHIFRYLAGTVDAELVYGGPEENGELELEGWSDASWGESRDRRSTSGGAAALNGALVIWFSKKQTTVALSSTESEYIAGTTLVKEIIPTRSLLTDFGSEPTSSTLIHEDNTSCIAIANNPLHQGRTKHYDIQHHFIRDQISRGRVRLSYINTKDQVADAFTKAITADAFERHRASMGLRLPSRAASGSVEGRK